MNPLRPTGKTLLSKAESFSDWLVSIRRHIHAHPEPAFQEVETSRYICSLLERLAIPFRDGVAGTGVVAEIEGSGSGPTVCLRADMDALSVEERTGLDFASTRPGLMHACGHDGHVAMLLGCARLLRDLPLARGRIRLLFQPAEEGQGGAMRMVEEGCVEGCKYIFGGHIDTHFHVGQIALQEGLMCAFADRLLIEVRGKGGHAARPHEAADSIVAASNLIVMLQSALNKRINPQFPAVVSIGTVEAGSAPNAIADRAVLRGTIRTTSDDIRKQVFETIHDCAKAVDLAFNVKTEVRFPEHYPPIVNSREPTSIAVSAAEEVVGPSGTISYPIPSLGGEDFSFYLEKVPGCFVRLGARKEGVDAPAHSSYFDFDERVLPVGASFFAMCALKALDA